MQSAKIQRVFVFLLVFLLSFSLVGVGSLPSGASEGEGIEEVKN
ncbi:MAG: hypothetical protein Q8M92_04050 [Candidatus Subteraquimicrobiales bacterium]|nr:hypothetical protein [Candidatus Subteraquimicrobiales bacterium]